MEPIRRRHAVSILAFVLAVVATGTSSALTTRHTATHALPAAAPAGEVLAVAGTAARTWEPEARGRIATPDAADFLKPKAASTTQTPDAAPQAVPVPAAAIAPAEPTAPAPAAPPVKPRSASPTTASAAAAAAPRATVFTGRNHVWIPSLGINRPVSVFPCSRPTPPDNYVYRWGCAGADNVYLLGHAYGVFKPLHDAYVAGRLAAGMKVWYADGSGTVHSFAVRWWRLTRPSGDVSWAWAAQATPSMTLQTCVGANSEFRLIVRLVQVG